MLMIFLSPFFYISLDSEQHSKWFTFKRARTVLPHLTLHNHPISFLFDRFLFFQWYFAPSNNCEIISASDCEVVNFVLFLSGH